MDILVSGWCGYEGSLLIFKDVLYKHKLLMRYSEDFFSDISILKPGSDKNLDDMFRRLWLENRAEASTDGGVCAALWRLLEKNKVGGTYSLRDIPIMQQTVEICETFKLNPYRLYAPSCRVYLTKKDESGTLVVLCHIARIPISLIGYVRSGPGISRTDTNKNETLRKPESDELFKLFPKVLNHDIKTKGERDN